MQDHRQRHGDPREDRPAEIDQLAQTILAVGQKGRLLRAGEKLEPVHQRAARLKLLHFADQSARRVREVRVFRIDFAHANRQQLVEPDVGRILALGHQHGGEVLGVDADKRQAGPTGRRVSGPVRR